MIKALDTKLKAARYVTWTSFFLFFISLIAGGRLETPPTPASLLAIISLPLIIMLPGMARENHKSLAMLSFVTLLYFIPLVVNVMSPEGNGFDIFSLVLICILFLSSMLFSRWKQYHLAGLGE